MLHPTAKEFWLPLLRSGFLWASFADLSWLWAEKLESFWDLELQPHYSSAFCHSYRWLKGRVQLWLPFRHRQPLSDWLQSFFLALDYPYYLSTQAQHDWAYFIDCIGQNPPETLAGWDLITQQCMQALGRSRQTHFRVTLSTIHRSKGLEFDCVILPQLQQPLPRESRRLLEWIIVPGNPSFGVLASYLSRESRARSLYNFCGIVRQHQQDLEARRLFYVCAHESSPSPTTQL